MCVMCYNLKIYAKLLVLYQIMCTLCVSRLYEWHANHKPTTYTSGIYPVLVTTYLASRADP